MLNVFQKICREFDWRLVWHHWSAPENLPREADVVVFAHSQFDLGRDGRPYVGVHMVRDPRDLIVSGYQYHRTTREAWCTNANLDETPPITAPRVPRWKESAPLKWQQEYLRSLNGKSYQENLRALPEQEGITFEMLGHSAWTIDRIREWNYEDSSVVELRFEDVLADYDAEMRRMFVGLGLDERWVERAVAIAATEDLARMDSRRLDTDPHIKSRGASRWQGHLTTEHRRAFKERFGNVAEVLGYEESSEW